MRETLGVNVHTFPNIFRRWYMCSGPGHGIGMPSRNAAAATGDALDPAGFVAEYELRKSEVAGIGIFATAPIPRGALIWRADERSVSKHTAASLMSRIAALSAAEGVDLLEHIYTWGGEAIEIVGDGKFWNHSRAKQNTGCHPDGNGDGRGDGVSSYALRDIEAGEELLDDYAAYDLLPWFEQICTKHGAQSCTSIGHQFIES